MRTFPLIRLREKLFGNTFTKSKSGSAYKKILGFQVRLSDHYVSKIGGGSTNRGDIEIILNPDDSFGINLNNREVDDLLYDWLEKESNETQDLDESGVLKMFDYLKNIKKSKMAKGGKTEENMSVQFTDYKGKQIMFEPFFEKYYTNDIEFDSMEKAKKYIDGGSKKQSWQVSAYRTGMMAKGGKMAETKKETYYIDFLNKKKNFSMDRVTFDDYEKARKWAMKNFESFDPDMIKIKFAKGGQMKHPKSYYKNLPTYNGYKWFGYENGKHLFSKKEGNGYSTIKAKEEDLNNGNIEFMTQYGWSQKAKGGLLTGFNYSIGGL